MSKIENNQPTRSREEMLYFRALINATKKGALNAVGSKERGMPYESVYRESPRRPAVEDAKNPRGCMENPEDLREWGKQMTLPLGREISGMGVLRSTEDCFSMDIHFYPHLKGWGELGSSDEMCARLYGLTMAGDFAMAEETGCELKNPTHLVNGDCACYVIYRRKQNGQRTRISIFMGQRGYLR